jgi:hypothetical protein
MAQYGLVTAVAVLLGVAFTADLLKLRPVDPYYCYVVHQRKDGSCPPGYRSEKDVFTNMPPRFTEADGSKEYGCIDLRRPDEIDPKSRAGVGLGKAQCTDFLRPGEKEADWARYVIVN